MKLHPKDQAIAAEALAAVRRASELAEQSPDIGTALTRLMAIRDTIVRSAITLKGLEERTRSEAQSNLESAA